MTSRISIGIWASIGLSTTLAVGAACFISAPITSIALGVLGETAILAGLNRVMLAFYENAYFVDRVFFKYSLFANLIVTALLFITLFAIGILNPITAIILGVWGIGISLVHLICHIQKRHHTYEVIA